MQQRMRIITGPALAYMRRRVGLSQVGLARALEVTPACVRDWEQGKRAIPTAQYGPLGVAIRAARLAQASAERAALCRQK